MWEEISSIKNGRIHCSYKKFDSKNFEASQLMHCQVLSLMSSFDMNLFYFSVLYSHFLSCINVLYFIVFNFLLDFWIFIKKMNRIQPFCIDVIPSYIILPCSVSIANWLFFLLQIAKWGNPIGSLHLFKSGQATNDF